MFFGAYNFLYDGRLNLVGWCLIFVGPQAGVDSCYFPAPRIFKFLVDIWKISGPHM